MTITNPYSKENIEKAAAAKRAKATVDKMMAAARKQSQKSQQEKNIVRVLAGKKAALTRKQNKAAQLAQYSDEREEVVDGDSDKSKARGPFQASSLLLYALLASKLKDAIYFEETGARKLIGKFPSALKSPVIDVASDPLSFYYDDDGLICKDPKQELTRTDFDILPVMFWCPELRWPKLYPK
jgi:hypothetical protein